MSKKWVLLGTIFILAFTATISLVCYKDYTQSQKPVQSAIIAPQTPLDANKILELVNIERAKVNVAPLVMDTGLVATAQSRADDMVARNYFSHNDPVTGESLVKIKPTNPQCVYAGENYHGTIADGDNNKDVITGWLNSPPHKAAMLDPKFTLAGVGTAFNPQRNMYVAVQHFCQV